MKRTDTRFVIDSSGWIEYFSDGKHAKEFSRYIDKSDPTTTILPTIVIYEVYKKLRSVNSEEDSMMAIAHMDNCTTIVDVNIKVAMKAAELSLEEKLPMADALIYSVAKLSDAKLVTSGSHFQGKEDVIFIF